MDSKAVRGMASAKASSLYHYRPSSTESRPLGGNDEVKSTKNQTKTIATQAGSNTKKKPKIAVNNAPLHGVSFLDLPAEIRNMIYTLVLTGHPDQDFNHSTCAVYTRPNRYSPPKYDHPVLMDRSSSLKPMHWDPYQGIYVHYHHNRDKQYVATHTPTREPTLLRTSSLIRGETRQMYYALTHLHVHATNMNLDLAADWLSWLGPINAQSIRLLSVVVYPLQWQHARRVIPFLLAVREAGIKASHFTIHQSRGIDTTHALHELFGLATTAVQGGWAASALEIAALDWIEERVPKDWREGMLLNPKVVREESRISRAREEGRMGLRMTGVVKYSL